MRLCWTKSRWQVVFVCGRQIWRRDFVLQIMRIPEASTELRIAGTYAVDFRDIAFCMTSAAAEE
jgi:hypothetical protein